MRIIVLSCLFACGGDPTPTPIPATGPSTAFFLGQFDQVATTLDDMDLDVQADNGLDLVALTVLNRMGAADSVRVMGAVANRSSENLCGIEVDYELMDIAGGTLLDTSSPLAGSVLSSAGGSNLRSCLRPGERGAFFDIETTALTATPAEISVLITGDSGYDEPGQQVVGTVSSIQGQGADDGRVEIDLENIGTTDADDVSVQIFARSASGTYTDWSFQPEIGRLNAGEDTVTVFGDVRIPVGGEVELFVGWRTP